MRLVYLGSGSFGLECLDAMARSSHELALIVTQPTHPAGRGRKARSTAAADWAVGHGVEFVETGDINEPGIIEKIASCRPDLIVVIAFGQKIGEDAINTAPKRAINVHGSLLPKYRGAAPVNWSIIEGERETGITILSVVEKMDAGAILGQAKTPIADDETAGRLHDRLAVLAGPLLLKIIDQIAEGSAVYTEQDHEKATLAPKLKKSDGFLDFSESADLLKRKILGLWPWPGGSAVYISEKTAKRQQVTIAMADVIETSNPDGLPAGTLDKEMNIICGCDALRIRKIKPANHRLMDFADFINGRASRAGDMFVRIEK